MPPDIDVGGQAVIEGVMIRSPKRVVTAIRLKNGEIVVKNDPYTSLTKRYRLLQLPVLRGVISFFEMLVIGLKTLNYSAEVAMTDLEEEQKGEKSHSRNEGYLVVSLVLGLGLGLAIFFFTPLLLASLLQIQKSALGFNLVAGGIRILLFLGYVWVISLFRELRRLFEYHGAEHKTIFAYEGGQDLTVEKVRSFSTRHPRCGTSYLLIVALFAILIFALADTIYALRMGQLPGLAQRLLIHFMLLPLVAGASYELLKLSGRARKYRLARVLMAPGLWIQRITTREPDDNQLAVALVALKEAVAP
ncbi:MAG: hypothetical protein AMJ92_08230 [candidate division Zixibacteria bacterium SM23_81]|nr:MAG: hypothetical protein AMJ92_08230 [candidate division Zixibacteria bacterium SM23_81]